MLLLLVTNRFIDHVVHRFRNNDPLARGQGDESIGSLLDVTDHLGIEHEMFAIDSVSLIMSWFPTIRRSTATLGRDP